MKLFNVNILYFNVRSLLPKIDNLRVLCSSYSPDIICVVESWLDSNITDLEISLQGYSVIRLDRCRHGGGVLMYIKSVFTSCLLYKGTTVFEFIVVSIKCTVSSLSKPDLVIALFYRPPDSDHVLFDTLFNSLCSLDVSVLCNFYLIGDFNVDFFNLNSPLYNKLMSVVASFSLSQIVSEPTRVTDTSSTLIDLIFVSSPTNVLTCSTIPPLANSDHNGLQLIVKLNSDKRLGKCAPRKVWNYSLADFDLINGQLENINWDALLSVNVDELWSSWKICFMHIMQMCIPSKTITPSKNLPWITRSVIKSINKKKALFRKYKCTGNSQDHAKYKAQRNNVVTLLRQCKEQFFFNLNSANIKDFWKAVKKVNKTKNITIPALSDGHSSVASNTGKADLLNNHFFNCFNRGYLPLNSTLSAPSESDPTDFPADMLCSEEVIYNLLLNLDVTKSTGVDEISARMLKTRPTASHPA